MNFFNLLLWLGKFSRSVVLDRLLHLNHERFLCYAAPFKLIKLLSTIGEYSIASSSGFSVRAVLPLPSLCGTQFMSNTVSLVQKR